MHEASNDTVNALLGPGDVRLIACGSVTQGFCVNPSASWGAGHELDCHAGKKT
jgi:hypothetical protein